MEPVVGATDLHEYQDTFPKNQMPSALQPTPMPRGKISLATLHLKLAMAWGKLRTGAPASLPEGLLTSPYTLIVLKGEERAPLKKKEKCPDKEYN